MMTMMGSRVLSSSITPLVFQRSYFAASVRRTYSVHPSFRASIPRSVAAVVGQTKQNAFQKSFFDLYTKRGLASQIRSFSSSSEESNEYETPPRLLIEWTRSEVQQFLLKSNEGMFSSLVNKLDGITGEALAGLKKADLIEITGSSLLGATLFNQLTKLRAKRDPWKVVSSMKNKLKKYKKAKESKQVTTDLFKFTGREMEQKVLIECFETSGEMWATGKNTDKKRFTAPLVCGGSGYGKTRFALQTKEILLGHNFGNPVLATAIRNAEQYIFPLKHNGSQLEAVDVGLGPKIYLGLRLLHGKTYPGISWRDFFQTFLGVVPKPTEDIFGLNNVLRTFPRSSEQQLLILIIDEFQESSTELVHYKSLEVTEKFSNALYRELMNAMASGKQDLFVFPIFAGTGLSSNDLMVDPTVYNQPIPIPMPGFSEQDTNTLVKNHFRDGDKLLKDSQFQHLLGMLGGVGRPLERLKEILDKYKPPLADYWGDIMDKLDLQLRGLYGSGRSWVGYLGAFLILLQGYPVKMIFTLPSLESTQEVLVEDFMKTGLVTSHYLESPLRTFSPSQYYLLGERPQYPQSQKEDQYFLMSAPPCYLSLASNRFEFREDMLAFVVARKILDRLNLAISFHDFEAFAVWQFFLRYLVSSWVASNKNKQYVRGSELLFGTIPQDKNGVKIPPVFWKEFGVASSKGVLGLGPYHRQFKFNNSGPDPFYDRDGTAVDLSDITIPFVALRLGGNSAFDGVLMVRDAAKPTNRTFFWIEATHVSSQKEKRVNLAKTSQLLKNANRCANVKGNDEHYIVAITNSDFRTQEELPKNVFLVDESVLDLYFTPSIGRALKYFKFQREGREPKEAKEGVVEDGNI